MKAGWRFLADFYGDPEIADRRAWEEAANVLAPWLAGQHRALDRVEFHWEDPEGRWHGSLVCTRISIEDDAPAISGDRKVYQDGILVDLQHICLTEADLQELGG